MSIFSQVKENFWLSRCNYKPLTWNESKPLDSIRWLWLYWVSMSGQGASLIRLNTHLASRLKDLTNLMSPWRGITLTYVATKLHCSGYWLNIEHLFWHFDSFPFCALVDKASFQDPFFFSNSNFFLFFFFWLYRLRIVMWSLFCAIKGRVPEMFFWGIHILNCWTVVSMKTQTFLLFSSSSSLIRPCTRDVTPINTLFPPTH